MILNNRSYIEFIFIWTKLFSIGLPQLGFEFWIRHGCKNVIGCAYVWQEFVLNNITMIKKS